MKPVNLLPEQQRRRRPSGAASGSAYVVVGVLAALLVMAVAYVLTLNQSNGRKTEAAEARQEADRLEARAAALNSFGDFAQVKATRLASVRQLAGGRFDWERFVRELSLILPRGSWLQEVNASVTGDPAESGTAGGGSSGGGASAGGGSGSGGGSTAEAAAPTAKLVGCMPRQPDVARMMVRLTQAHRVSDVALNESAEEEGGGEPSLESCGRFYKFDLTVRFEPPPPSGEAPEGRRRVPASLGGGS